MRAALFTTLWALVVSTTLVQPALGQPDLAQPAVGQPAGGLPAFLAKMKRQDEEVHVVERTAAGSRAAPAGVPVAAVITAGGSKVRQYDATTAEGGLARFVGLPTNPEVQDSIGYVFLVDFEGVRFPFEAKALPAPGGHVELQVQGSTTDLSQLIVEHAHVSFLPDEENLVLRHTLRMYNRGDRVVNLAAQPDGGLRIPVPIGAKHPELHEDVPKEIVEVRGINLYYKGAILPGDRPAELTFIYTVAYGAPTLEFVQTLPVRTVGGLFVLPQGQQAGQRIELPLRFETRGGQGVTSDTKGDSDRAFQLLRFDGLDLPPGSPLRFAVTGLPSRTHLGELSLLAVCLAMIAFVVLGFRRPVDAPAQLSRSHLEAERDRLLSALDRLRKAATKGRVTQAHFEREQEVIAARLVTLFRALDVLAQK